MSDEEIEVNENKEHGVFIKSLKKKFEGAEFRDAGSLKSPFANATGSLSLDIDLSVPIYEGSITEIYSNAGAGKTTLTLSILAEAASRGKKILFLDQEQALQATLVNSFPALSQPGVLEVITAPTGDEALEIARLWVLQYPQSIVAIDSVDALLPKAIGDNQIGEAEVGNLSRLMSQGCRKLRVAIGKSKATVIFLNQMRNKIGGYGNPTTTSGGNALKFYADQRIELMDISKETRIMNDEGNQIGHVVRYKIIKNKIAPPFLSGEFPLIYGKGIDRPTELVSLTSDLGLLPMEGKYILVPNKNGETVKKHPSQVADMLRIDVEFYNKLLSELQGMFPETFRYHE